jgi:protein TonB
MGRWVGNEEVLNQENQNKSRRQFPWAVLFSLLLHLGIFFLRGRTLDSSPIAAPQAPLIELSELPPDLLQRLNKEKTTVQNKPQVVETEDSGNREIDPNAQLLSDRNQKAEQQSRAARTDDFRQGKGTGPKDQLEANQGTIPPNGSDNEPTTSEDLAVGEGVNPPQTKGVKRNWKTLSLKDLSVGGDGEQASASDDYLPNITNGERTILSTREFRYFSYYNRIKDLLRQYWKPSIEREVAKLWGKGRMLNSEELTTRVLVLLDKTGKVQKISKIEVSGFSEIDEAAIQAFYQAAPFPNPPTGLVDTDGFVRINWDFILKTASAPRIQFRPGGPSATR